MPTYVRNFYPGVYCHVFVRGVARQNIFNDDSDYLSYLKKLREIKEKHDISLICYCLMPNHTHLLLRQDGKISISRFIHSFHTRYSMYFNNKYDRAGHLFQGTFGGKNVEDNEYLSKLASYIHLNPVINGFKEKLHDYRWSSYPDYIDERNGTLCDKEIVLGEQSAESYKKMVEEEMIDKLDSISKVRPFNPRLNHRKNSKVRPF